MQQVRELFALDMVAHGDSGAAQAIQSLSPFLELTNRISKVAAGALIIDQFAEGLQTLVEQDIADNVPPRPVLMHTRVTVFQPVRLFVFLFTP